MQIKDGKQRATKRWFYYLRLCFGFFLLLLLSHSFWLPGLIRLGVPLVVPVEIEHAARVGLLRMEFEGITYRRSPMLGVSIERLETPSVFSWLAWKLGIEELSRDGPLELTELLVDLVPKGLSTSPASEIKQGLPTPLILETALSKTIKKALLFTSSVSIDSLQIRSNKGSTIGRGLYLDEGHIVLRFLENEWLKCSELRVSYENLLPIRFSTDVSVDFMTIETTGEINRGKRGGYLTELKFLGEQGVVQSAILVGNNNWSIQEVSLESEQLKINKLPFISTAIPFGEVSFEAIYDNQNWRLRANNLPSEEFEDLLIVLEASGDKERGVVNAINLSLPGIKVSLKEGFGFNLFPFLPDEAALFHWQLNDLIKIGNFTLEQSDGRLSLRPRKGQLNAYIWEAKASLKALEYPPFVINAEGDLSESSITWLAKIRSDDQSLRADFSGGYDLKKGEIIDLVSGGEISANYFKSYLNEKLTFDKVNWTIEGVGRPESFSIDKAEVQVSEITIAGSLALQAQFSILGGGVKAGTWESRIESQGGAIEVRGEYEVREGQFMTKSFGGLRLRTGDSWEIEQMVFNAEAGYRDFRIVGKEGEGLSELSLNGGISGSHLQLQVDAEKLNGKFAAFLFEEVVVGEVNKLNLSIETREDGLLVGDLYLSAHHKLKNTDDIFLINTVASFSDDLSVKQVLLISGKTIFLEGKGQVPVKFSYGTDGVAYSLDEGGPVDFQAKSGDLNRLSQMLDTHFGIGWSAGEMDLSASGTVSNPLIHFRGGVENLEVGESILKGGLKIDHAQLKGEWNEKRLVMESFNGSIGEQQFEIEGEIAWPSGWLFKMPETELWTDAFDQARFSLKSDLIDLEAVQRVWPSSPVRTGMARFDFKMSPGKKLSGDIEIKNGASLPFGNGDRISKIDTKLSFNESIMTIEKGRFNFRNRPIDISGKADLVNWPNGSIDLKFSAKSFPIVREEQLILRANASGEIFQEKGGVAVLRGEINLLNSVFMQDLTQLARPSVSGVGLRYPYFSVKAEPYRNWKIDIALNGTDFLRIETPLFRGLSSADFNLTGSLEDPILAGELRLSDSKVRFPFGDLKVESGLITLLPERAVPEMSVQASGESFGYMIDLNVSGLTTQPQLNFISSPPLSQDEILLMLTSGVVTEDGSLRSTSGGRATQLAGYFGNSLITRFASTLGKGEGLANRIRFEFGTEITESGQDAFRVELLLSEDFLLYGEYDRFDAYNANLKWEIFELK